MSDASGYRLPSAPTELDYNFLEHFRRFLVQPPGAVYVTVNDTIQLRVWSPDAASTVNVSIRLLLPADQIIPIFGTVTVQTVGSVPNVLSIPGAEGFLLSATIETPGAAQGQCYVTLELVRGLGTNDQTFGQLLIAGYPGASFRLGYPQSVPSSPTTGRGAIRSLTPANPPAGVDFTVLVPVGVQWILRSAAMQFAASAVVGNRTPALAIADPANVTVASVPDPTLIVATTVETLTWAPGVNSASPATLHSMGFVAECRLLPGWRIKTSTLNIDGADRYSNIAFMIEEFISA